MTIRLITPNELPLYEKALLDMLTAADDEFLPPLSARDSTTQATLSCAVKGTNGVVSYFEQMKSQRLLIAEEDGVLCGFVSFKENYQNAEIGEKHLPNIYISTLVVSPIARGKGLTKRMYTTLFELFADRFVCTRTWSLNTAHIRILGTFGFETLCTLKNDRGEGVDTVYFVKPPREI